MTAAQKGAFGEKLAAAYYKKAGYKLLAANYRTRFGEVDLIVQKGGMYVFAEVKTRGANSPSRPAELVGKGKQQRLILAAQKYLQENNLAEPFTRFDVVEVIFDTTEKPSLTCLENAFGV
ncbi:MAG: YraN family protein [Oscillospiraceae bacterium]